MARKRKNKTPRDRVNTLDGGGSPAAGQEFVVEIEAPGGKWLRVAGVSYRVLADALVKKLTNAGHRVRVREAPAEDVG